MVGVYWTWNPWWYFQLALGLFVWLSLFLYRKSWKRKNEIKGQIIFGFVSLGMNLLSDTVGVLSNLWHYAGGDWPAIIWPLMFIVGVAAFQLFKFVDERWVK